MFLNKGVKNYLKLFAESIGFFGLYPKKYNKLLNFIKCSELIFIGSSNDYY